MIDAREMEGRGALRMPILAMLGALNFFKIGFQLVIVAWSAVQVTGRGSSVGQVLLICSITNLAASPFTGRIIDLSRKKRIIVILGHIGGAISGVTPLIFSLLFPSQNEFIALILTTAIATVSGAIASGAMDYFTKKYITSTNRIKNIATLNLVSQITLIFGVASGGAIVSILDFEKAFLACSTLSLISMAACHFYLPNIKSNTKIQGKNINNLSGPVLYFKFPFLFFISCCTALAFSVGQVTNTLLPALISIHLKETSVSYSMVEASWSLGAICAGIYLSTRENYRVGRISCDLLLIACMAFLVAIIPRLANFTMLITAHFLLGIGFSTVRIRSETRFLLDCPNHFLGRFRANGLLITSLIGFIIYLTPTIFPGVSVPYLYQMFAGLILAIAFAIASFSSRLKLGVPE